MKATRELDAPWNQNCPDRFAASVSEIGRPEARLNIRPKFLIVSTQCSPLSPNRSKIGAKSAGIEPFDPARIDRPVQSNNLV